MDVHKTHRSLAGDIGEKIAKLTTLGFPFPKGFVVSSAALEHVLVSEKLSTTVTSLLKEVDLTQAKNVSNVSSKIKKIIRHIHIPEDIQQEILSMYVRIGEGKVMIIPSPVLTPGESDHYTDLQPSFFGYTGDANVLFGIREVWSHLFDTKPLLSRVHHQKEHTGLPVALCVLKQPKTVVSGILYTHDPTANRKSQVLVKAVWGEGGYTKELEGSDYYWLDASSGKETEYLRCDQYDEYLWDHGEQIKKSTPSSRVSKRKIEETMLKKLGKMGRDLQQQLFFPQECVFTFDGTTFTLLSTNTLNIESYDYTPPAQIVDPSSALFARGKEIVPGLVHGTVRVVTLKLQPTNMSSETVLVASSLAHISPNHIKQAKAIILEEMPKNDSKTFLCSQHGIPTLGNVVGACTFFQDGMKVKLNTHTGEVSREIATLPATKPQSMVRHQKIPAIVPVYDKNIPSHHVSIASTIFIRPDWMIAHIGAHPKSAHGKKLIPARLNHYVSTLLRLSKATSCIVSLHDFTPDQYNKLQGGTEFETVSAGSSSGLRGNSRFIAETEIFEAELQTLLSIKHKHPHTMLTVTLPSTKTASEYVRASRLLTTKGLERSAFCKHALLVSIPSLLVQLPTCIHNGVDHVFFDCDSLLNNLFGISGQADDIHIEAEEKSQVLLPILKQGLSICNDSGVPASLFGESVVEYGIVDLLSEFTISSICTDLSEVERVSQLLQVQ